MPSSPETLSLAGKAAIVTGSGRTPGLGSGIATALARNGAAVAINYVSDSTGPQADALAAQLRADFGVRAIAVQADVATPAGAELLVRRAVDELDVGKVHILVNNAGCNLPGSTLETPLENIDKQFSANVFAAIHMVRAAVPHMPSGGRIINVGTVASKLGIKSLPFYSASKAASDSLTFTWAAEFGASHGITVNTVAPGPVETDEMRKFARDNADGYKSVQDLIDMTRAGDRLGGIDDIADAVLLLVQEKSRWITGQFISLSGGITGN